MMTNRNTTRMAPTYTRICRIPISSAPSRMKMAASENIVLISQMADTTAFRWRMHMTAPSTAPKANR